MIVTAFAIIATSASAQVTISIPKIPKIKKSQPNASSQSTNSPSETRTAPAEEPEASPSTASRVDCSTLIKSHLKDIATTRADAEEYKPGLRSYYVRDFSDRQNIYLKAALSHSRRKKWLDTWDPEYARCMQAPLDDLAAVARKTLPTYHPSFVVRNPVEEKILRTGVGDIANATVFKIAFEQAAWKIDKDQYNFPTARYKHGMIWAKYPALDDGFCRIISVNLVQDYAGGGTYGESYPKFIASEFAGCPVGK